MSAILRAERLSCARALPGEELTRLSGISLAIEEKTSTVIRGPSGSGKNLLLRLLGLLELPDSGEVFLHDAPTRRLDPESRAGIRNQHFGFMFADPFLLPSLSVIENVAMPLLKISATGLEEAGARTESLLDFVGLPDAARFPVDQLSHAEQHRVSLARALVNNPAIVMAEALDSTLDETELRSLWQTLKNAVDAYGVTILLSAAAPDMEGDRVIEISGGMIATDTAAFAKH